MLTALLSTALVLATPPAPCTEPLLTYIYDARGLSADGYAKTCWICDTSVTIETEVRSQVYEATRAIALPDLSATLRAVAAAPVDELCDGPMDTAGVEYWIERKPRVLFSAAGSSCWIQSEAPDAAGLEALIDRLCDF